MTMGFPVLITYTITRKQLSLQKGGITMEDLVIVTVRKQHFVRSKGHSTEFSVFESTTNI